MIDASLLEVLFSVSRSSGRRSTLIALSFLLAGGCRAEKRAVTPPEEKPAAEAPAKIESPRAETTKVPGSDPKPSALAQCPNECHGSVSSEFISALRARGGQTRGCYNRALRKNPALEGKLVVRMKVGITGEVCSVEPKDQTLQDQEATECILDLFRSAKLPAPQGGCVETAVPLNFVSKH